METNQETTTTPTAEALELRYLAAVKQYGRDHLITRRRAAELGRAAR